MATKVGGAYIEVRADNKALAGDLYASKSMVEQSAANMQKSMEKAFKRIKIASMVAGAAVVAVSLKILALGREFETTMKTVQAWSGATGKELKDLTDIARKMGGTTEWTANQAAEALKYLAAAGFTAEQSITALPGTLDLATAGQVDLARATDITTDVLTAFGMEVNELERVSDAFITVSSSSNTNVLMLGESFKMVAPTAKLFGLSVEQTAAMLGTLANSGIKAEMAGSGLNMVLMRSAEAAKKLGLDAMTPLVDSLKKMKEEQWNAVQIGEVFGVRQVKTAAILMNNIPMYEKLTEKILENKGATKDLAVVIRDSLDNDLKVLNSTIQDEMLSVYDEYKGSLRDIVQKTTTWIQKNDELIKQEVYVAVDKITKSISTLVSIYNALPSGVVGAVGVGILGKILTGSTPIGQFAAAIYLINEGMSTIGMGLGDLSDSYWDAADNFQKAWETIKGQRVKGVLFHAVIRPEVEDQSGKFFPIKRPEVAPVIPAPPPAPPPALTEEQIKAMREQEDFAIKMADQEAQRIKDTEQLKLDTLERFKVANMAETESALYALDKQFLAYNVFVQDKDALDRWYVEEYNKIMADANAEKLAVRKDFDQQYNEMGKSQFDLERSRLDKQVEIWRDAKVQEDQISRLYAEKSKAITQAELQTKLSMYQSAAGNIANTFMQISQAGGKQSKEAFIMYKAFAIIQAGMAARTAIVGALGSPPYGLPAMILAGSIAAMAGMQIAMIASAQPPSYDQGGISEAKGIYQTGNIREAHIPLPSGEKIPVKVEGEKQQQQQQQPTEINIMNALDPAMVDRFLSSARGQDAILNVIGNRAQSIRRVLR